MNINRKTFIENALHNLGQSVPILAHFREMDAQYNAYLINSS